MTASKENTMNKNTTGAVLSQNVIINVSKCYYKCLSKRKVSDLIKIYFCKTYEIFNVTGITGTDYFLNL